MSMSGPRKTIEQAPGMVQCDLRDEHQSLIVPMSLG